MKIKIALLLITVLFITSNITAQEVKFGKVTKKELEEKFYPEDTVANAAVLYKNRRTFYELDADYHWVVKTIVHERIKIYNKDGFKNATKKVGLYSNGGDDELFSIKAYTYNLKGGKIEKTKLEKSGVFKEDMSKHWKSRNFTLPNLKDGSIVEWRYTITSPYYASINDVSCQYKIPIKYLYVKIQIPEYFEFKYLPSRYYSIKVKKSQIRKSYTITSKTRSSSGGFSETKTKTEYDNVKVNENTYVINETNIPALKDEPYVNNIYNYRAKVAFEISAYRPTNGIPKFYNTTWEDVTKTIYESQYFGEQLNKKSHYKDDLANINNGTTSQNEKIISIFNFVKSKMKWNEEYGKYVSNEGIKNAYKNGVGNVAEINLTLVSMLKEAGLSASPILVSTRAHGIPLFPTKNGYNYVIAGVEIQNRVILLDATEKYSAPNVLPLRDLNWEGRLIRENGSSTTVSLYPSKYNTKKIILATKLDFEGTISGMMVTTYTNLNALQYRDAYASLAEDDLISKIESNNNAIEIEKIRLNHKNDLSKPIVEMVKFARDNQVDIIGDKMYISPLLFLTISENPFKQENRLFPIDYGSAWKNEINIAIQVPEGYSVASKPEDFSLVLPNNLGSYILKTEVIGNKINVTSQTKINTAIIGANHYKTLKGLYKKAIDNQLEKIVLVQGQP